MMMMNCDDDGEEGPRGFQSHVWAMCHLCVGHVSRPQASACFTVQDITYTVFVRSGFCGARSEPKVLLDGVRGHFSPGGQTINNSTCFCMVLNYSLTFTNTVGRRTWGTGVHCTVLF